MAEETNPDWSTDSTDAVNISLVIPTPGGAKAIASFKPQFTYSLFGEQESIFGYKGLKINIAYNACDMRPNVNVSWEKKYKQLGETEALDIMPILEEFLPSVAFEKAKVFEKNINTVHVYKSWTPPGDLIHAFDEGPDNRRFEVWKAPLSRTGTKQFLKRIQVLVPFFIDGGTPIDLEEASSGRWTLFLLFERKKDFSENVSPYVFMGYSTVYRYYPIGDINQTRLKGEDKESLDFILPFEKSPGFRYRARISQFIILPPFQSSGHGARLYQAMYAEYKKISKAIEVTVEDPNESFDDLRDINDLAYLRTCQRFLDISIDPKAKISTKGRFQVSNALDLKSLEDLRIDVKIAPRQFSRVVEMQLLSKIPANVRQSKIYVPQKGKDEKELEEEKEWRHVYHLWQLVVKTRLHKHNREQLVQIDKPDRADLLEAAAASVEAAYVKTLEALDKKSLKFMIQDTPSQGVKAKTEQATSERGQEEADRREKRAADSTSFADQPKAKKLKSDTKSLPIGKKASNDVSSKGDATNQEDNTVTTSTNE